MVRTSTASAPGGRVDTSQRPLLLMVPLLLVLLQLLLVLLLLVLLALLLPLMLLALVLVYTLTWFGEYVSMLLETLYASHSNDAFAPAAGRLAAAVAFFSCWRCRLARRRTLSALRV